MVAGTEQTVIYLSGIVRPELLGLRPDLGVMMQPNMGNRPDLSATKFAVDTGCFTTTFRFDIRRYMEFLSRWAHVRHNCLFATAPDVVGDARLTLGRSMDVLPIVREMGYPAAFVAQDGCGELELPWDAMDCLFVGGSTAFKLSEAAYELAGEAKRRGKWTHMGRVNSGQRFRAAALAGYDSVDGTYLAFGPEVLKPKLFSWLDGIQRQTALW